MEDKIKAIDCLVLGYYLGRPRSDTRAVFFVQMNGRMSTASITVG